MVKVKTAKPISPKAKDERVYQRKLVGFLKVNIQAPLARVILNAQSPEQVLAENAALADKVLSIDAPGQAIAEKEFTTIATRHTSMFKKTMANVIPEIDFKVTDDVVKAWLTEKTNANVQLIQGMNQNQFELLSKKLNNLFADQGFDRQAVAKVARDCFRVGDSRAKLIGRDQVSKATGELNNIRQTEVGIERYKWRTAEDTRVRPEHAANNGKIFSWGDPPPTGHPGHDVNCRCVAIPVID